MAPAFWWCISRLLFARLAFGHLLRTSSLPGGGEGTPQCALPNVSMSTVSHACAGGPGPVNGESVRIFSYGANMGCAKLEMLGLSVRSSTPAVLQGQCLVFGSAPGIRTSDDEPAFGSLELCDGCVHGVVHEFLASQVFALHDSEPGYDLVDVPGLVSYDNRNLGSVSTYVMRGNVARRAPSPRYAGLIYCAASKMLSASYREQLLASLHASGLDEPSCLVQHEPINLSLE